MGRQVMWEGDATSGKLAEVYVTLAGNRYNFFSMTKFESKWEAELVDVPLLGQVSSGHKPGGAKGTWEATAYFNQSVLRRVMKEYKNTARFPYFEIQVTNEDPTSTVGRQTITHSGCLFAGGVLAKFDTGSELLEEDISGVFSDWDMPEEFDEMEGMR